MLNCGLVPLWRRLGRSWAWPNASKDGDRLGTAGLEVLCNQFWLELSWALMVWLAQEAPRASKA